MAINEYGAVTISSEAVLIKEVKRMLPHTTVTIIGPSGTGKTTIVEKIAKEKDLEIDETIIFRLQGLSSEDFRLPIIETKTIKKDGTELIEKEVNFANVGVFKRIKDNPNKRFLLFLDEVIRADASVAPLLFGLLEGKLLDGQKCDNLYIMTAINYGDDYSSNIDFTDDALRRRQIFIDYSPSKDDFINFATEKDYHPVILELAKYVDFHHIMNHITTKELMQPSTFGSWDLLNKRWKDMEKELDRKLSMKEIKEDILIYGAYFFNDTTVTELVNKITSIMQMDEIDIQKEIINKDGLKPDVIIYDKKGNIFPKEGKEKILAIRTLNFIKDNSIENDEYLGENGLAILQTFEDEKPLLMTLIKQIELTLNKKYKGDQKAIITASRKVFIKFSTLINECCRSTDERYRKFSDIAKEFSETYTIMNS